MSPFLIRLLVAVLVYFLGQKVIETLVSSPDAARIFSIILLLVCVFYALFGWFLPTV